MPAKKEEGDADVPAASHASSLSGDHINWLARASNPTRLRMQTAVVGTPTDTPPARVKHSKLARCSAADRMARAALSRPQTRACCRACVCGCESVTWCLAGCRQWSPAFPNPSNEAERDPSPVLISSRGLCFLESQFSLHRGPDLRLKACAIHRYRVRPPWWLLLRDGCATSLLREPPPASRKHRHCLS